ASAYPPYPCDGPFVALEGGAATKWRGTGLAMDRVCVHGVIPKQGVASMIQANVRQMLTRSDAQLVLRLLSRDSDGEYARVESILGDHGIDELLDDPRLPIALREARQGACASYPLFSYVMVRHALRTVGETDRVMADYAASILLHFGLRD